jgi:hypothetical protein
VKEYEQTLVTSFTRILAWLTFPVDEVPTESKESPLAPLVLAKIRSRFGPETQESVSLFLDLVESCLKYDETKPFNRHSQVRTSASLLALSLAPETHSEYLVLDSA